MADPPAPGAPEPLPPVSEVETLVSAVRALARGDWAGARAECDAVDREAGSSPQLRGEALLLRGIARHAAGDASGGLADACGAFLAWRSADPGWLAGRTLGLARLLAAAGDADGVRHYIEVSLGAARAALPPRGAAQVASEAGGVMASAGLDRDARRMWELACTLAPEEPPPAALVNLARLDLEIGDLRSCLARLEAALKGGADMVVVSHAVAVGLDMCAQLADAGDFAAATAAVVRLAARLPGWAPQSLRAARAALEHDKGVKALEAGESEAAEALFQAAIDADADPDITGAAHLALAVIENSFGRTGAAVDHLREAGNAAEDLEQSAAAAALAREVGEGAAARGDLHGARLAFALSANLYGEAGYPDLAHVVATQASELRENPPQRRAPSPNP